MKSISEIWNLYQENCKNAIDDGDIVSIVFQHEEDGKLLVSAGHLLPTGAIVDNKNYEIKKDNVKWISPISSLLQLVHDIGTAVENNKNDIDDDHYLTRDEQQQSDLATMRGEIDGISREPL